MGLSRKIGNGRAFWLRNIQPSRPAMSWARPTANVGTSILPPEAIASLTIVTNSSTVWANGRWSREP